MRLDQYALSIAFLGAIGYVDLLELLQTIVFLKRSCNWIDLAANTYGVIGFTFWVERVHPFRDP